MNDDESDVEDYNPSIDSDDSWHYRDNSDSDSDASGSADYQIYLNRHILSYVQNDRLYDTDDVNQLYRALSFQLSEARQNETPVDDDNLSCYSVQITKCLHFENNCEIVVNNDIVVDCILCYMETHTGDCCVTAMKCKLCNTQQKISNKCISCDTQIALYYCSDCKIHDNDEQLYHCSDCNKCVSTDMKHCDTCNTCITINHQCKNWKDIECAICHFDLENETIHVTSCGHEYHYMCIKKMIKFNDGGIKKCPMCRAPL
jgi:hypothetical protein